GCRAWRCPSWLPGVPPGVGTLPTDITVTARTRPLQRLVDHVDEWVVWSEGEVLSEEPLVLEGGSAVKECSRGVQWRNSALGTAEGRDRRAAVPALREISRSASSDVRQDQALGMTRPVPAARAASKRAWTSAQFTMFQMALT